MVTVGDHFPRIVFSFVQKVSGEQTSIWNSLFMLVLFVVLKLLWNRKVGNKIVITRYLGYDGDNSTHPWAAPSDSDYYQT